LARRHAVVSGHYCASLAGLQVLEAGGNAIDAGVATGLAIDVLESEFVGFGGVAPVMLHLGETRETQWPSTAAIFLPGGRPPEVGEIFVQADLGRALQYMADQERAHGGGDRLAG